MDTDERNLEASALIAEGRQDAQVARIRAALTAPGREDCAVCGEDIGPDRLAALPSATRCVRCQSRFERRGIA